jgi:hypothetical protein
VLEAGRKHPRRRVERKAAEPADFLRLFEQVEQVLLAGVEFFELLVLEGQFAFQAFAAPQVAQDGVHAQPRQQG